MKRVLEGKVSSEKVKGKSHHELQCPNILENVSNCHGIYIDPGYKKYVKISFHGCILGIFKIAFVQRSSCSQGLLFQINRCIPGCNNQKQLATAFFKKIIFL